MKFNMKTDLWVRFILWGCILMFVPFFFLVPQDELYILALSTLIMAVIILPLFRGYYELGTEGVEIHMYGFKKTILYDTIKSIRTCENWISGSAMSRERIEIKQHNKSKLMGTTYISPVQREEFFSHLKLKCRNLERVADENTFWDQTTIN